MEIAQTVTPTHAPMISMDELKQALPVKLRPSCKQDLLDRINLDLRTPELAEAYKDNLLGYTQILAEGKYKLTDYMNAVKYVSYILMGKRLGHAYRLTFPQRYQRLVDLGKSPKTISAYSSAYDKNQLVNKIREQSLIPVHILNAPMFQEAINVQASLMRDTSVSAHVRSNAADSLMQRLAPPAAKLELDITIGESQAITDLREATEQLVAQQKEALRSGALTIEELAEKTITVIDPEKVEVERREAK